MEKKEKVMYKISQKTRDEVLKAIGKNSFSQVFPIMKALEKDILTEEEANAVINAIGNFPYVDVYEFFGKVPELFEKIVPEDYTEKKDKKKTE